MKDKHIIEVLDNASIAGLSEIELTEIRGHVKECARCREAFDAAQLSAVILKQRVQVTQGTIRPSPFFQTKVMAALREQQAVENVPAMFRLWKSAKVLVSSMAVTTAALAALSFALPAQPATPAADQAASAFSADAVIMGQANDDMTYEQVLSTIYADDDDAR